MEEREDGGRGLNREEGLINFPPLKGVGGGGGLIEDLRYSKRT